MIIPVLPKSHREVKHLAEGHTAEGWSCRNAVNKRPWQHPMVWSLSLAKAEHTGCCCPHSLLGNWEEISRVQFLLYKFHILDTF